MDTNDVSAHSQSGEKTLAILGFHKIGSPSPWAWETWYYIPEATFVDYLGYLYEHGWHVIDVAALLRCLAVPTSLPGRAALITFDDGYQSVLDVALPHLVRFGYPAVHFVPTAFIGGRNWFDGGGEPEEPICDWAALRELERRGVSVQAHGVTHRHFSALAVTEMEEELTRSKQVLEDGLGRAVELFSFPYGDDGVDPAVTGSALQRTGYRAACLYGGGPNRVPISNSYRLTRLAMGPDTDLQTLLAHG